MDINELPKEARSAAMRGGTDEWGEFASSTHHVRYAERLESKSRRRCHCGCKRRATHRGMANGIGLMTGCEMRIRRWVKTGD